MIIIIYSTDSFTDLTSSLAAVPDATIFPATGCRNTFIIIVILANIIF